MANLLDEVDGPSLDEGLDTKVVAKRIPVTVGVGSKIFEIILWCLLIIPGVIFLTEKIKAKNYFQQLEQRIQRGASQIDNYMEQRVVILQNCARLLDKAIDLDKSTYESIAKYRSGITDEQRNELTTKIDNIQRNMNVAIERYPELKAHEEIKEAMKQNTYLQREITAARELYNDMIDQWNRSLFMWPTKQIVAAREGYTTKLPFIASSDIKQAARGTFF